MYGMLNTVLTNFEAIFAVNSQSYDLISFNNKTPLLLTTDTSYQCGINPDVTNIIYFIAVLDSSTTNNMTDTITFSYNTATDTISPMFIIAESIVTSVNHDACSYTSLYQLNILASTYPNIAYYTGSGPLK